MISTTIQAMMKFLDWFLGHFFTRAFGGKNGLKKTGMVLFWAGFCLSIGLAFVSDYYQGLEKENYKNDIKDNSDKNTSNLKVLIEEMRKECKEKNEKLEEKLAKMEREAATSGGAKP